MGLMTSHSQKVDLNMAPGTKHCELILDSKMERIPETCQDFPLCGAVWGFILCTNTDRVKISFLSDLGRDKMATIIQSGRDHGLPTYTQVQLAIWPK